MDERIALKYISPEFGHMPLTQITTVRVSRWLAALRGKGLAPATCNRILAVLRAICTFAEKRGYFCPENFPCAGIASLKVNNIKQRALTEEEARLLMQELKKHDCQEAAIIRLLLLTGARKSEILKARWEDVDLDKKILKVPLSKSGSSRIIFLSDEAISIIKTLSLQPKGEWLFPGRLSGKPLSDVYIFWNKIRTKLCLNGVRIHDLRHSFASFLVNAGHSLYVVQQLLGHANPRTTMRYAHLTQTPLHGAAQAVSEIITVPSRKKRKEYNMVYPFWHTIRNYLETFNNMIRNRIFRI